MQRSMFQVCPVHAFDDIDGEWISDDVGWRFTCHRRDHVMEGPYSWLEAPRAPVATELTGIAADLRLDVNLPSVVNGFGAAWAEYGLVERAYALAHPRDWEFLMNRYSHTAVAGKTYTTSAFLAATLGRLHRAGHVALRIGPATGRWSYNSAISYWTVPPEPSWESRLTWEASGHDVTYVPGQTERF